MFLLLKKKITLVINNLVFEKVFVVKNDRICIILRTVAENLFIVSMEPQ